MIQEKDFLYRVPVKNALVTAPGKQARNPEILVDLEGGEFMHGNILDANSTNKLIDRSVKDAIADVIASAPEDLDTLKEIADKLAGNDDLHTALNQAITEKADASALANEVTRATGVENDLRTAIGTKADATALSNYVLTTALNQQVDTLNAAISAKQDAGNYIPYDSSTNSQYSIGKNLYVTNNNEGVSIQSTNITGGNQDGAFYLNYSQLYFVDSQNIQEGQAIRTTYSINGITSDKYNNCLATSDGTFKPISDFALKTDIPQIDTSDFISKTTTDDQVINSVLGVVGDGIGVVKSLDGGSSSVNLSHDRLEFGPANDISTILLRGIGIDGQNNSSIVIKTFGENPFIELDQDPYHDYNKRILLKITNKGISSTDNNANHVYATDGSIADLTQYALANSLNTVNDSVSSLRAGLLKKQNKITVNKVNVTGIKTADITELRTIVISLIDALSASGLIEKKGFF